VKEEGGEEKKEMGRKREGEGEGISNTGQF